MAVSFCWPLSQCTQTVCKLVTRDAWHAMDRLSVGHVDRREPLLPESWYRVDYYLSDVLVEKSLAMGMSKLHRSSLFVSH
jgi:hypothetical protein